MIAERTRAAVSMLSLRSAGFVKELADWRLKMKSDAVAFICFCICGVFWLAIGVIL